MGIGQCTLIELEWVFQRVCVILGCEEYTLADHCLMPYSDMELSFVSHFFQEVRDLPYHSQYYVGALQTLRLGCDASLNQTGIQLSHAYAHSVPLFGLLHWLFEHLHGLNLLLLFQRWQFYRITHFHLPR